MSDGVDAGVEETHHRLMGFDTEDSRGERAILSDLSNYARPLLTPRGDRVVFTHRRENRVYVVGWDGSGLRCLGRGYAMAVWRDPTNGMEWVYGGTQIPGTTTYHPIQRVPIDQPDRLETIWTKTPVDADNFQLSADGRRACGAFPWPACGMAELPDRDWKKYGDGCWPSLAPDNSALLWIFDGAHRNLTLFREDTDERWVINISHAPGIGGYEVYHPRWSNNPRFMTMTGPYKLGEGDNRIRGGGPDVEIYIGRFDSSFRAIDRWIRVTHNARADFFPDVWIASRKTRDKPDTPIPASTSVPPKVTAWPGNTEGLVFLWENRSKKNEIPEASGPALRSQERRDGEGRVCRAEPRGEARYGRFFEMDLSKGIFIAESGAGELLAAFRKHNQISIEALLVPRQTHRPEFFRIMSFAADTPSGNFMLGQERDRLALRLLTSATNVLRPAIPLCGLTSGVPHHVIISYAPGHLACFLNGEPLNVTNVPADSLDSWIPVGVQLSAGGGSASGGAEPVGLSKLSPYSKELVFGDRDRFWPGTLDHIALYNRVIEAPEARQKYDLVAGRLKHRLPVKPLVVDARLTEASKLPTPAAISPYRRALVVNRYGVVKVIQGSYAEREVMAAHWAILDGRLLDTAPRQKDKLYRMTLEPFDEHPELEGERLIMESGEFLLPLYYEVE